MKKKNRGDDMLILERLENDWAMLELDGQIFRLPAKLLPPDAKEGVCLTMQIAVDHDMTQSRQASIRNLFDGLFE